MKTNRWEISSQPKTGKILVVSDEGMGYWTPIRDGEDWQDVLRSFASGYDHNDTEGEVHASGTVIVDDEEKAVAEMSFGPDNVITLLRVIYSEQVNP